MGRKECMESRPAAWVANIERVAPDTSVDTQARATAPEHNETQKEEQRSRDIVNANKTIPNPTTHIHFVCGVEVQVFTLVCGRHADQD